MSGLSSGDYPPHIYTSYKPTDVEAVIEFGERQPQCFWQMEWQVVKASQTGEEGA